MPPGGYGSIPSGAGVIPDPLHGFETVRQIYDLAAGEGTLKKYTVPILWDEKVCIYAQRALKPHSCCVASVVVVVEVVAVVEVVFLSSLSLLVFL